MQHGSLMNSARTTSAHCILYLRATQIGWFCTPPGIALGAGLGSVNLNLPLLVGAGGYLALGGLLAVLMPEQRFLPTSWEKRMSWQKMQQTLGEGFRLIRLRPALGRILGISAFSGIAETGFGRLWQYHLLPAFTFPTRGNLAPILWFGMLEIDIAFANIGGIEIVHRCITLTNQRSAAWGLCITQGVTHLGIAFFALTGQFPLALASLWFITTASGPRHPLTPSPKLGSISKPHHMYERRFSHSIRRPALLQQWEEACWLE